MGAGGSRFGAGRPATKVRAEQCLRLDVRRLAKHDAFKRGGYIGWRWKNSAGEQVGAISIVVGHGSLRLTYSVGGRPVDQLVHIETTPCNYGGSRPWLACPRCGRRVAVLFMRGGNFLCRACGRVAYGSQSDDLIDRTWRQQHRLEACLSSNYRRPKGMHHRTYARLLKAIGQCDETREDAMAGYLANMATRMLALGIDDPWVLAHSR